MLELQLTLQDDEVKVKANRKESHQFSFLGLGQTKKEWDDFLKNPRPYGEKLFNALFRDAAKVAFDALSRQTERTIVLVLESPELDRVTWEYAYNKAKEEYVVEDCAFMRALPESERSANGRLKASYERVPLLFIPANPLVDLSGEPMRALDEDSEWREISKHITASNAGFDLLNMLPATPEQLQTVMAQFHEGLIVHFSGHGGVEDGKAILLFEEENGASNPLNAREFEREIKDKAVITFLSACQSAVAERTEFSNLARGLVKAGVPFALGMQFNLPDPFAPEISGQFYNYLARGHGVPEAARQARRAVKREHEFFVGMIALHAARPDEVGKLAWRGAGAQTVNLFRPADVSDLPSPASGLIGRQRELMRIGTRLLEDKKPLTVTLHGTGGIGKTALLWQALLRFAPSFELTFAIALEPLPSLEGVLGRIERFLSLPIPCSNDTQEREAIVRNALTSRHTLLGLDNFETLNYALNEKGSDEEKTAKRLHAFFKSLSASRVTLCATSREVTNLPGEIIVDIEGLSNESGGRLFQENVIKQEDKIYIEKTQQVSEMVGGHPLALRLLASGFDDQVGTSLDQYIQNLQTFLPKARDKWTEEGRHESLRASFDFTMNSLSKTKEGRDLQFSLAWLSMFIAFFADLAAASMLEHRLPDLKNSKKLSDMLPSINKIMHALWERGLLERISIPEENFYLYRLHPTLRIFAREQLADVEIPKESYWKSMSILASTAEKQKHKNSLTVQIAFHAVPDLITAAEFRSDEDAMLMQLNVSTLLDQFGYYDDSLRLLGRCRRTCQSLNDLQGEAATLQKMAGIYITRGDLDEAMNLYQQLLRIVEGSGKIKGKSPALHGMANIYAARGDLDKAMKLYKQSLEVDEGVDNVQYKSPTLLAMAKIFITRGDFDRALQLCQQSLEITIGDLLSQASMFRFIADIETHRGNLDRALVVLQQTLDIADQFGDASGKSSSLQQMANIYLRRGDLQEAMNLSQQSLEIKEAMGDQNGKSASLYAIAQIYVRQGDIKRAMIFYGNSLEIDERLGDIAGKATILVEMANISATNGDLNEAIMLYQQSLEIEERLGNLKDKAITLGMMGQAFWASGFHGKAISSLFSGSLLLAQLEIEPQSQQLMSSILVKWRREIGAETFDVLWQKEIGQPVPDWLK